MAGYHFHETMSGSYRPEGAGGDKDERPMHFTVEVHAEGLLKHALHKKARLAGRLHMQGFAEDVELHGEITINPLFGKLIRYEFDFVADDGQRYHFSGQKDVSFRRLFETMTTLPGTVVDGAAKVVARANLLFDKRHLPRFLASFRPRL